MYMYTIHTYVSYKLTHAPIYRVNHSLKWTDISVLIEVNV